MSNIKEFNEAIENNGDFATPKVFIADAVADLTGLPGTDDVAWGSFTICLENGKTYALRQSGDWEVFG